MEEISILARGTFPAAGEYPLAAPSARPLCSESTSSRSSFQVMVAGSTSRCLSVLCGSVGLISLFGERDLLAENARPLARITEICS